MEKGSALAGHGASDRSLRGGIRFAVLAATAVALLHASGSSTSAAAATNKVFVLTAFMDLLREAPKRFIEIALPSAENIFMVGATVTLAWKLLQVLGDDLKSVVTVLIREGLTLGLLFHLVSAGPELAQEIVNTLQQVGKDMGQAAGYQSVASIVGPQVLFDDAVKTFSVSMASITASLSTWGKLAPMMNPMSLCALAIFVCQTLIALYMFLVEVESFVVLAVGSVLLGLGGVVWLRSAVLSYFRYAIAAGLQLLIAESLQGLLLVPFGRWKEMVLANATSTDAGKSALMTLELYATVVGLCALAVYLTFRSSTWHTQLLNGVASHDPVGGATRLATAAMSYALGASRAAGLAPQLAGGGKSPANPSPLPPVGNPPPPGSLAGPGAPLPPSAAAVVSGAAPSAASASATGSLGAAPGSSNASEQAWSSAPPPSTSPSPSPGSSPRAASTVGSPFAHGASQEGAPEAASSSSSRAASPGATHGQPPQGSASTGVPSASQNTPAGAGSQGVVASARAQGAPTPQAEVGGGSRGSQTQAAPPSSIASTRSEQGLEQGSPRTNAARAHASAGSAGASGGESRSGGDDPRSAPLGAAEAPSAQPASMESTSPVQAHAKPSSSEGGATEQAGGGGASEQGASHAGVAAPGLNAPGQGGTSRDGASLRSAGLSASASAAPGSPRQVPSATPGSMSPGLGGGAQAGGFQAPAPIAGVLGSDAPDGPPPPASVPGGQPRVGWGASPAMKAQARASGPTPTAVWSGVGDAANLKGEP